MESDRMGLLQRWLDEPDASIARFAKAFYVLTYVFLAVLAVQLGGLALHAGDTLRARDVLGPFVSVVLTAVMYLLALDGRRSHKALMAKAAPGSQA
jgi:hypothetical protein